MVLVADAPALPVQETLDEARRHLRAGRLTEAEALCRSVLQATPDHASALFWLGRVNQEAGRTFVAVAMLRKAIALESKNPMFQHGLAMALMEWGHLAEAERWVRQAIELDPTSARAYLGLGLVMMEEGKEGAAAEAFQQALAIDPTFVRAHLGLGIALHLQGREEEAERSLRRTIELEPMETNAYQHLGGTLLSQGQFDAAVDCFRRSIQVGPGNAAGHSNLLFILHFVPSTTRELLLDEARAWGAEHADGFTATAALHRNDPDPHRRLRIGYVSADFHRHPVGYFLGPVAAAHDKGQVEVFCYHNSAVNDDITARFRQYADHWRSIVGVSDDDVASMIRRDAIDVLVDLAGHTGGHRLLVFARKPAPVQVSWMGYFGTTGMAAMDYVLLDRFVCPEGDERFYTERAVRLPDDFLCYSPQAEIEVGPLPALSNGHITFCCFNKIEKIGPAVVALWAEILRRVPQSRLALKAIPLGESPGIVQRYKRDFAHHGVAAERLTFSGRSMFIDYLAAYNQADIALDPFPFNGGTTTIEALWMGVPVVTLAGTGFVGRMGVSHLSNAGFPELIAQSPMDYVSKAVALAGDRRRLAELRSTLRDRLLNAPLCDGIRYTKGVEAAYRTMWDAWCATHSSAIGSSR